MQWLQKATVEGNLGEARCVHQKATVISKWYICIYRGVGMNENQKPVTDSFRDNFDVIFGKKPVEQIKPTQYEPIPFAGMVDTGDDNEQ